jgi:hypothetical protein
MRMAQATPVLRDLYSYRIANVGSRFAVYFVFKVGLFRDSGVVETANISGCEGRYNIFYVENKIVLTNSWQPILLTLMRGHPIRNVEDERILF